MSALQQDIVENGVQQGDLVKLLTNLIADVTAIRTGLVGVTAQLDADGGVTDTDYAADNDPAAITSVLTKG